MYVLMNKGDAFVTFKYWKAMIENQTGKKIKRLRSDNGLEYLNADFLNLCQESGIVKHHTVPHNPQQHALAERYSRTILERVRCMLIQSGLPKTYWGEAVQTACYLINRCPSSAIGFRTLCRCGLNTLKITLG